ncbi:MAG: hypothetical protein ACJ73E_02315 [Mycobacteriales bacterium]
MADGFSVEVGTLQALSGQLSSIGERVSGAQGGLDGLGDGQTGDGELASALHHFRDGWDYSLKKIGETARAVADKATVAAAGYEQTDRAVADAAAGRT